jgi:hypothetical protein
MIQGGKVVGMPAFFVTAFLGGAILVGIARADFAHRQPAKMRTTLLPLAFLVSLSAGSIYPTSNVVVGDELRRISGHYLNEIDWSSTPGRTSYGWSREGLAVERNLLSEIESRSKTYLQQGLQVGYFGVFGNTVELVTGVENLTGIPAPESLRFGENQQRLACVPVNGAMVDVIFIYDTTFPCAGYTQIDAFSNDLFRVVKRIP